MNESQFKKGKSNLKQIPLDSLKLKKNKSQISNNYNEIINSKKVKKFLIDKDKKIVTKHNSNYKLGDNIKLENNSTKYSFIKNLRSNYSNVKNNNIKNLSHNEIFLNKSINEPKQKTTIHRNIKNKNYSLNRTNISSTNKKTKKLQKIPSTLEKKINSYLIPKSIATNHHNNQIMKFINGNQASTLLSKNNKIKNYKLNLLESKSNKKPNPNNILSKYFEQTNYQKLKDNNSSENNNKIDNHEISQPNAKIIKIQSENKNKNNDLKYNSYLNFIEDKKINTKFLDGKYPENNNKNFKSNNIFENIEKSNNNKKYVLKTNKSIDNIKDQPKFFEKKLENLITKDEKEDETDKIIAKKLNNIIENLKIEKKNKINKFINLGNKIPKEILYIEKQKEKKDEENFFNLNDKKYEILPHKENKINDKILEKQEQKIIKNSLEQNIYEQNNFNKNFNYLNGKQKEQNEYKREKLSEKIKAINGDSQIKYKLNINKDDYIKNIENNNNSNLLEQINSKFLLQKTNLNNKFHNNDIIKINIDNIKNNYSNKKDLVKINEKENIPQLIAKSLTGLVNLGETCYMNTGLQNLIHCFPFINLLFSALDDFKDVIEQKLITKSFINLCSSIIKIDNYNLKYNFNSYNPTSFRNVFCKYHNQYTNNEQHDSLEFTRTLLDDISKEMNQTKIICNYKELSTEGKSKEQQNKEYNDFYLCRENSIVVKIFYSQIMNIFVCDCGDISYSFEKILDIPLLFPKEMNDKEINLNDLISIYFNGENITWNAACQKCNKRDLKRNKKIKMTILPKVLIFSLQRFNPITGVKINKYINYDEVIDLKPYCDNDFFNGIMDARYKLFGISNHSGTINFGHYYSYTKIGNNWYEFNDSFVKLINLTFSSKAAYFFFYEKID